MKFEDYINDLIHNGIFPGVSILFGENGNIVFKKNFGSLAVFPEKRSMVDDPIYDLASLTKPLVTSFLAVTLVRMGELTFKTPMSFYFPGFSKKISIKHLLTHTSGLPPWYPLYACKDEYLTTIKNLEPVSKPGKKVLYSCIGYILLGFVLEKILGTTLDKAAENMIFSPLGLKDTSFSIQDEKLKKTSPTERGNAYEKKLVESEFPELIQNINWRKDVIHGEVNDCNAFYLGRASGNAGLFSTAKDIFTLSGEFFPESATILEPDWVKLFWKNFTMFKRSFRSYGFKINSSPVTSGGRAIAFNAIGHNGFTGTSIWMEKRYRRVYIILSNRIHPKFDKNINFNRIRRRIHRLMKKKFA